MIKDDTELFIPSYLNPGDMVCTTYDFVTNLLNKNKTEKTIKPIFRGQVGIVNFEIVSVNKKSVNKLKDRDPDKDKNNKLSVVKNIESVEKIQNLNQDYPNQDYPEEIYYCVDFIDFEAEIKDNPNYPEDLVFETLIIQRKHLLVLRKELVYAPKEKEEDNWKNVNITQFHVETELQIQAKEDQTYEKFLDIYNYKSLLHDNSSDCSKIGEVVTVQEVLYEHDDINLEDPIVWPGQLGIIVTPCKNEKEQVEVIFLNKSIRELLYFSRHSEEIPKYLNKISTNNENHRQIKIKIEKKFLLPLYAKELKFEEKQKELRNQLEAAGVLKPAVEQEIFQIRPNK